jgi:hypothetical protein
MRLEAVIADTQAFGVRQGGSPPDLDALALAVHGAGARLVLEVPVLDERLLGRLPPNLGLAWDLATPWPVPDEELRASVEGTLCGLARGRLVALRAARLEGGRRVAPGPREARVLESVWRLAAPGSLVYDVDDPSGFGAELEIRELLARLRDFHGGGQRPHDEEGGGLFWASLAPG